MPIRRLRGGTRRRGAAGSVDAPVRTGLGVPGRAVGRAFPGLSSRLDSSQSQNWSTDWSFCQKGCPVSQPPGPRRLASTILIALACSSVPVVAVVRSEGQARDKSQRADPASLGMLDARVNRPDALRSAIAARPSIEAAGGQLAEQKARAMASALAEARAEMPGLEVALSGLTGAAKSVKNRRGALTEAAPGKGNEAVVRDFLASRGGLYGLTAADLNDLVVLGDSPGGSSGLRMLRMEQQIDGLSVFQSETRFILDRQGRLVKSVGQMVPRSSIGDAGQRANCLDGPCTGRGAASRVDGPHGQVRELPQGVGGCRRPDSALRDRRPRRRRNHRAQGALPARSRRSGSGLVARGVHFRRSRLVRHRRRRDRRRPVAQEHPQQRLDPRSALPRLRPGGRRDTRRQPGAAVPEHRSSGIRNPVSCSCP